MCKRLTDRFASGTIAGTDDPTNMEADMAKTTHVRVTLESRDALDALTGDSILVVAGLGPLTRSEVVTLGCHLVTLLAQDLVAHDDTIIANRPHPEARIEGDPRMMTDVVPSSILDLVYNRWMGRAQSADMRPARVRLEDAIRTIRELCHAA